MEVDFNLYYERVMKELKKNKKRNQNYIDNLDLLLSTIFLNNDFTELEKVARLRNIVYNNGSLGKRQLKNIDKELGYEKYYEESYR